MLERVIAMGVVLTLLATASAIMSADDVAPPSTLVPPPAAHEVLSKGPPDLAKDERDKAGKGERRDAERGEKGEKGERGEREEKRGKPERRRDADEPREGSDRWAHRAMQGHD